MSALDNVFRCDQGTDKPWFFVPDTGTPGGSAVLEGPDGPWPVTETQECPAVAASEKQPAMHARVGFRVPITLDTPGDYTLVVDQDGTVTRYEIDVLPTPSVGDSPAVAAAKRRDIAQWPKRRAARV